VQQHLQQQEIQKIGVSVHVPSSANNDTLKVATEVKQIVSELHEAVSGKDKMMVIIEMIGLLYKRNKMASGGSAMNSVKRWKTCM
jgi:hypothetical protein